MVVEIGINFIMFHIVKYERNDLLYNVATI